MKADARLVRPATTDDVAAGVEVVVQAGMFTIDDSSVVRDLLDRHFQDTGSEERLCLVSECAGGVTGIAYAQAAPAADRLWYLTMIGVRPSHQRNGTGSELLAAVERNLRDQRQRLLLVETSALPAYAPARSFYRRCGYQEEARVRDFHEDGDDMVLFTQRLTHTAL